MRKRIAALARPADTARRNKKAIHIGWLFYLSQKDLKFFDLAIGNGDAAIHARGKIMIMRGDQRGQT